MSHKRPSWRLTALHRAALNLDVLMLVAVRDRYLDLKAQAARAKAELDSMRPARIAEQHGVSVDHVRDIEEQMRKERAANLKADEARYGISREPPIYACPCGKPIKSGCYCSEQCAQTA